MAEKTRVVPERNALKPTALTREPTIVDGKDPAFHYEWLSLDPSHPSYVGRKLIPHEIGDSDTGYARCDAWTVIHRESDPGVALRNKRDDQGGPVDTVHRHGDNVLCATTRENHAKYVAVHDRRVELNSKGLSDGSKQDFGTTASKAIVSPDGEANYKDLIEGVR